MHFALNDNRGSQAIKNQSEQRFQRGSGFGLISMKTRTANITQNFFKKTTLKINL